jgi:hypothetical protein
MESYQKLLLGMSSVLLITLLCDSYINKGTKNDIIRIKINHTQRLLGELALVCQDLRIKGVLRDLSFGEDVIMEGDETIKTLVMEAINQQDEIMIDCLREAQQCLKDVLEDLK